MAAVVPSSSRVSLPLPALGSMSPRAEDDQVALLTAAAAAAAATARVVSSGAMKAGEASAPEAAPRQHLDDLELGSSSLLVPPPQSPSMSSVLPDLSSRCSWDSDAAEADVLGTLKVLTLNVWVKDARTRMKEQVRGIRRLDPDVICLQEVFDAGVLYQYGHAFPDYELVAFGKTCTSCAAVTLITGMALGTAVVCLVTNLLLMLFSGIISLEWLLIQPLAVLVVFLVTRHHFFFVFLWGNKTGLAMLVRRSAIDVDLDQKPCQVFSPLGHAEDFLNILRPRGYISVPGRLRLRGTLRRTLNINLMTTHLNQPVVQPRGAGRHRQVQEIVDRSTEDSCKGLTVVGCDLNATPPGTQGGTSCNTYRAMAEHFSDAWAGVHSNDVGQGLTWDQKENPLCISALNSLFWGIKTLRWRCDYVFWRYQQEPDLEDIVVSVRSCDMVFTGGDAVSDHYGIFAVFEVRSADGRTVPSSQEDTRRRLATERECDRGDSSSGSVVSEDFSSCAH